MTIDIPQVAHLKSRRSQRYLGENLASSLQDLKEQDAAIIHALYAEFRKIFPVLKVSIRDEQPMQLLQFLNETEYGKRFDQLVKQMRAIEHPAPGLAEAQVARIRKNLHDVRGGALAGFALQLDLLRLVNTEISNADVLRTFYLVRDHLKIMRNCFKDLDQERREMDRSFNFHSSDLIKEKWEGYGSGEKKVRYRGEVSTRIACCCLEFSTVDRIIYNLMNNAFRYGVGTHVDLEMHAEPKEKPQHLLVTIGNPISADQTELLRKRFEGNPSRLFLGEFTTSGSGEGMRIGAECVCNAYGFTSVEETIEAGLVGAQVNGDYLAIWFFWPLLADVPDDPTR